MKIQKLNEWSEEEQNDILKAQDEAEAQAEKEQEEKDRQNSSKSVLEYIKKNLKDKKYDDDYNLLINDVEQLVNRWQQGK